MQGLKINECGDQIVPIPIQRNNCIESVRLRKEILVNSAKMQESVEPLTPTSEAERPQKLLFSWQEKLCTCFDLRG